MTTDYFLCVTRSPTSDREKDKGVYLTLQWVSLASVLHGRLLRCFGRAPSRALVGCGYDTRGVAGSNPLYFPPTFPLSIFTQYTSQYIHYTQTQTRNVSLHFFGFFGNDLIAKQNTGSRFTGFETTALSSAKNQIISDSRGRSTINIYYCIEVTEENQSCVTITKTR